MDIYKAPESDIEGEQKNKFSPVKAIVFGWLVSVVVVLTASVIETTIAAMLLNVDVMNESSLHLALANNMAFLLVDLSMSSLIMFYAGRVIRRYAVDRETMFAVILSLLTLGTFYLLVINTAAWKIYPVWYNALTIVAIFAAIMLGARKKG
ncbi:MAG: hypothetical protein OEZ16_00850 [Chromatiales bacterium]|nr:hypothetical protein [Chromatiales bacterium]